MKLTLSAFSTPSLQRRLLLVLASIVIYILAFFPLYQASGAGIAALALVPSIIAGWFLGLRLGILATALIVVLNTVLIFVVGAGSSVAMRGLSGNLMLLLVAAIVGWLRELLHTVQTQSQQLTREREALQQEIVERQRVEEALRQENSERKRAEEAARNSNQSLEQKHKEIEHVHEFFLSTAQQMVSLVERGSSKQELLLYLNDIQVEFIRLDFNVPNQVPVPTAITKVD